MPDPNKAEQQGSTPFFTVQDLTLRFGGILALDGLSFDVGRGEICALIGPNGAGKTSLFNCLSRLYQPNSGRVHLDNVDLLSVPPHRIAHCGVARTFQNLALVPTLTVLENVMTGGHPRLSANFLTGALSLPGVRVSEKRIREEAFALLRDLELSHLAAAPTTGLPYGTLKRIELARALAARPSLLLLDEPASGLTHGEVDELGQLLVTLKERMALTIILVEHHMGMVMGISDRVVVLNFGVKIAEGPPAAVQRDPQVIEAYLGSPA